MLSADDALIVGRVVAVHGINGLVKVYSYTDPPENIFSYQPWYLSSEQGWEAAEIEGGRRQGKSLVVRLNGCTDRNQAEQDYIGREVAVARDALPPLAKGDYYWRDLIGLRVLLEDGRDIGRVGQLMETGANDVLVVRGDGESLDRRERLIPWLPEQVVRQVDLQAGRMTVDWDPEF
jgi:16S rRNA processing protein RimM